MNENMETRTFLGTVEKRAQEDENKITITGMPIVFNAKTDIGGWWEESIDPGAVDADTLKDVRLLVNHDFNGIPLARSRRNTSNSTMCIAASVLTSARCPSILPDFLTRSRTASVTI